MNMYTKIVNNGVNTEALLQAKEALTEAPAAAQFKWRATCDWVNGTHSCSQVEGFYGLGDDQQHKTCFTFDADHPDPEEDDEAHGARPSASVGVRWIAGALPRSERIARSSPKWTSW